MNKKIAIALYGKANQGKTSTSVELFRLISNQSRLNDIAESVLFRNNTIGFVTSSDPYQENLKEFQLQLQNRVSENCDIIVCTSRTKGESVRIIEETLSDYDIIWLSNLASPTLPFEFFNNQQAIFLLNLINRFIDENF